MSNDKWSGDWMHPDDRKFYRWVVPAGSVLALVFGLVLLLSSGPSGAAPANVSVPIPTAMPKLEDSYPVAVEPQNFSAALHYENLAVSVRGNHPDTATKVTQSSIELAHVSISAEKTSGQPNKKTIQFTVYSAEVTVTGNAPGWSTVTLSPRNPRAKFYLPRLDEVYTFSVVVTPNDGSPPYTMEVAACNNTPAK
jgi:hypothetical protein